MSQTVSGVEVRSVSGAWLTGATIVDYENSQITVAFDAAEKPNQVYDVSDVRFASAKITQDSEADFAIGDECELFRSENEGWFLGTVVNTKGGFYVVEFDLSGQTTKERF